MRKIVFVIAIACNATPALAQSLARTGPVFRADTHITPAGIATCRPLPLLTYDHYRHLGVACKIEWKLEKMTSVPLKIRVGSVAQADFLERKPNARLPE